MSNKPLDKPYMPYVLFWIAVGSVTCTTIICVAYIAIEEEKTTQLYIKAGFIQKYDKDLAMFIWVRP